MNLYRGALLLCILMLTTMSTHSSPAPVSFSMSLMPVPAQISPQEGKLIIDSNFRVSLTGLQEPMLQKSLSRFVQRLAGMTGIAVTREVLSVPGNATLEVHCERAGEIVQSIGADESYSLEVTPRRAVLSAPTPVGVLRGLETFLQLVACDSHSFAAPAVAIQDRPRFRWRGLLIDACRHWQPPEVIKRNLDAMAALKMNVLHWHLSEDQGFRVESKLFPKLHTMGSDGNYYTQEQIREIVAYARDRGIRVMPEFDMPGHTTAWFVGYPELATSPGPYQIHRSWGIAEACMDPTRDRVYSFIDAFIGEMSRLFPDEYFHIGGDEVNGKQWHTNPRIRKFKRRHRLNSNRDLQTYFNRRLLKILTRHGKKMVGWDEILHPDLPKSIVVQSWRGQASMADAVRQGYMGILSAGYYLDHILPASAHYLVDPLDQSEQLSLEAQSRILGGEACMWTEYVSSKNIDARIWPRTAAIAERLWSPAVVRDVADMYRRLELTSRNLDFLALEHNSAYPAMLQRLAGSHSAEPVRVLADILEPVKRYERSKARPYTSFTPLDRLVDAAQPESDVARHFAEAVEQALANRSDLGSGFKSLRPTLVTWRDNDMRIQPILEDAVLLKEAAPLSETLTELARSGLQAIDYLQSSNRPTDSWHNEQLTLLDHAQRPQAELLIMIVPSIRKLVEAAFATPEGTQDQKSNIQD